MARGTCRQPAKQRTAIGNHSMSRIGIFGISGMAREAGDIAWELGSELVNMRMTGWPCVVHIISPDFIVVI